MDLLKKRNIISFFAVLLSSLIMAFATKNLVRPAGILSGGFMGIAIMVEMVTELFGPGLPTSIGLLCLNIPVALFCAKKISSRFVFFSLMQVILTSFFLTLMPRIYLFNDTILNVIFGGFLFGGSISIALKGNASSGGTDFIALYISNKSGHEIWDQVFVFNAIMLMIFGCIFGFEAAGYSILFQFISTKTVSNFHTRYKRVMLQIFTKHKNEIMEIYCNNFHHGMTVLDGIGGYSKEPVSMLTAIVSSYEVDDVIMMLKKADPKVIINVTKSEKYVGSFYNEPL
ncbi:MAG: YitT family protein [[Clostridium] spiroforme]|uniref:YitT family protein n=1 Tax=Thomasclavelia spiroformis TaxID=29348 RepID=A0A943EJ28_9FIRM|nr:YitT family protein [Thomasclavelia spiroformis]MBS5587637.1 YitT family protein [Thomasclavelia spiroformis]